MMIYKEIEMINNSTCLETKIELNLICLDNHEVKQSLKMRKVLFCREVEKKMKYLGSNVYRFFTIVSKMLLQYLKPIKHIHMLSSSHQC